MNARTRADSCFTLSEASKSIPIPAPRSTILREHGNRNRGGRATERAGRRRRQSRLQSGHNFADWGRRGGCVTSAGDTSVAAVPWAAVGTPESGPVPAPSRAPPRRRLFRKYALLFVALVGTALLINSGFDFWFSFQENKAALIRVQQEKAEAAAQRIEEFVDEIKSQIGWTTHAQWDAGPLDQRRQDYFRLMRQAPAITELQQLDREGREKLKVSRLSIDVVPQSGAEADFSQSPAFREAKAHRVWFSPVYFRKQSEPYMTLAVARDGRNSGVTVAEINLKLILEVIIALKTGQGGYVYVVDGAG